MDRWKLREVFLSSSSFFFLVFLKVPFWRRGCGEGAVRMRNTVLQFCLWSAYCCFATGDPAPRGQEGRLQGNVHLFLLPPPQFLFWPRCPLSCPPFFLDAAASSLLSACAVHLLLLISLAVHLFLGASDQGIPEPAGYRLPGALARARSGSTPLPLICTLIDAVQSAELAASSSLTLPSSLNLRVFGARRLLERALSSGALLLNLG